MTQWIDGPNKDKTSTLLAAILSLCTLDGERVQFLCPAGAGPAVVQRLRVSLSRSRKRNIARGKKIREFTLHDAIYPYTDTDGIRHDCVVMYISKTDRHVEREILDDLMERS